MLFKYVKPHSRKAEKMETGIGRCKSLPVSQAEAVPRAQE